MVFKFLKGKRLYSLTEQPLTQWKTVSWYSEGTSCVSVCAHCLWSWHWAPLKRVWLQPLYNLPTSSYTHWEPFLLYADETSSLSLCSQKKCHNLFITLVALRWTTSTVFMSLLHLFTPKPFIILVLLLYLPSSISFPPNSAVGYSESAFMEAALSLSHFCLSCRVLLQGTSEMFLLHQGQVSHAQTYTAADHREVFKGQAWQSRAEIFKTRRERGARKGFPIHC